MTPTFLSFVNNPEGSLDTFFDMLRQVPHAQLEMQGNFVLCIGSTETSDVPGISAAGATPAMRRLTPSADAEALVLGKTVDGGPLPASPAGIASPVVITRASLSFLKCPVLVVDCGSFVAPKVPCLTAGLRPARCLSSGEALELSHVYKLFNIGFELGERLAREVDYLILGECVPGGTTTALGLLTALGYRVERLVSTSLPQADHGLRVRLVREGLKRSGLAADNVQMVPLNAVAALGDPMQPTVAGIALAASRNIPVILAGGSQMLAIWALAKAVAKREGIPHNQGYLGVVTTKWVAFDHSAGLKRLSTLVGAPFAAACPNFHQSRHPGLRAYEDGHVKEGAGAGGSMAAAFLVAGASPHDILAAIDAAYDELVVDLDGSQVTSSKEA